MIKLYLLFIKEFLYCKQAWVKDEKMVMYYSNHIFTKKYTMAVWLFNHNIFLCLVGKDKDIIVERMTKKVQYFKEK